MPRIMTIVSLIVSCAATAWAAQSDRPAASDPAMKKLAPAQLDALLTRMEKDLSDVKSLSLDFEQEKHLSLLSDTVSAKGVCLFVRPNIVRFEITEPFHSVLIARDRSVAKFEFLDGKWHKLKLPSPDIVLMVTREIASWLKGSFRQEADVYEISAFEGESTVIVLTPRAETMRKHIVSIELRLAADKRGVVSVVIREPGGDYTYIAFVHERRNAELAESLFDTTGQSPVPLPASPQAPEPSSKGG